MTPGANVGPYRLERLLGRGGMGEVWAAVDVRTAAEVALKLVPPTALPDPDARARFEREARLAMGVQHPHVVRTLDVGVAGTTAWLALELLPGGSLADRLKSGGALPWREAAALAAQAARGLDAAHASGLIHRDVKPANLLLDAEGRVRVGDFGLVRRAVVDGTSRALTRTGEIVGTPEFLAPEQAEGTRELDRRADLYALGATLHALVAGRPPFTAASVLALLQQHIEAAPPPLRALVPAAPRELEALVLRLLAKRPDERPSSAAEVAAELEAIARHRPRRARRTGPRVTAALGVVALVVGGLLLLRGRAPATPPPPGPTSPPSPAPPVAPAPDALPPRLGREELQEVRRLVRLQGLTLWQVFGEGVAHRGAIGGLALTRVGAMLVSVGSDGVVRAWNIASGAPVGQEEVAPLSDVAVLDDAGSLLVCGAGGVWWTTGKAQRARFTGVAHAVAAAAVGRGLVACDDGGLRLFEGAELRAQAMFVPNPVRDVALDPRGERGLAATDAGLWIVTLGTTAGQPSIATRLLPDLRAPGAEPIRMLSAAVDGDVGWAGGDDGSVEEVSLTQGTIELHPAHEAEVSAVAVAPGGGLVATASADRTVRVWNPRGWTRLGELDLSPLGDRALSLVWTTDAHLFVGTTGGRLLEVRP